jgi:ketosteroid isomerase-like protein
MGRHCRQKGEAVRKDWQTLELCDRFFDSIEQNDYESLEACYAPEAVIWHSHDCRIRRADGRVLRRLRP